MELIKKASSSGQAGDNQYIFGTVDIDDGSLWLIKLTNTFDPITIEWS